MDLLDLLVSHLVDLFSCLLDLSSLLDLLNLLDLCELWDLDHLLEVRKVHLLVEVLPLVGLSFEAYGDRSPSDKIFLDNKDHCSSLVVGLYNNRNNLEEDVPFHHLFFFIHLSYVVVVYSYQNHLFLSDV